MKRLFTILSLVAISTIATANPNFTGVYLGAEAGYRSMGLHEHGSTTVNGVPFKVKHDKSGFSGGVFVGYNMPIGASSWYGGFELSFNFPTTDGKKFVANGTNYVLGNVESGGMLMRALAKFGYIFTPKLVGYLQGGFGHATSKILKVDSRGVGGFATFGAGLEYAVCPKWRIRLNYLYDSFPTQKVADGTLTLSSGGTVVIANGPYSQSPDSHNVLLGFVYQF